MQKPNNACRSVREAIDLLPNKFWFRPTPVMYSKHGEIDHFQAHVAGTGSEKSQSEASVVERRKSFKMIAYLSIKRELLHWRSHEKGCIYGNGSFSQWSKAYTNVHLWHWVAVCFLIVEECWLYTLWCSLTTKLDGILRDACHKSLVLQSWGNW